jgi:fermentation-respiration switch protein FrsA (DUF1100 family)
MKIHGENLGKLAALLILLFCAGAASGAAPEGIWEGKLDVGAIQLRLVFHIERDGDAWKARFDSPDQGAAGIPFTSVSVDGSKIELKWANAATFQGTFSDDGASLSGHWNQSGQEFPIELKKVEKASEVRRPQNPVPPYPYTVEEVTFPSAAEGVTLAGTITIPKGEGPFPAAVLVSGSGPQDRDETLLGHKPFLVLADHLARAGVLVLRFDDRGVGKSTGSFAGATSMDFAEDVKGALRFIRQRGDVKPSRLGIIGHSEGALIAPIVAAEDREIGFIVLLAGPGVSGRELLPVQLEAVARASGAGEEMAALSRRLAEPLLDLAISDLGTAELKKALRETYRKQLESVPEELRKVILTQSPEEAVDAFAEPWMRGFLRLDPRPYLQRVRCPVLAITGEKDRQVDPDLNLPAIQEALEAGGNKSVTVRKMAGLNHLFQSCTTGAPMEYATIEETFNPEALRAVSDWILGLE